MRETAGPSQTAGTGSSTCPQQEDAHRYREFNGAQILATLRSLAINALRLDGIWSITKGIGALANEIKGLLTLLGWTEPATATPSGGFLIGPGMSASARSIGIPAKDHISATGARGCCSDWWKPVAAAGVKRRDYHQGKYNFPLRLIVG